ncbi:putative Glucan endo-1,3-beta-glucosidase eglC [Seiridium unicorne]|uniref:glucan endo-1,3-beta-D-glucosidase n=1 Tax=Seiridium unicorne TaxID=138068 RepID=A0ABR2UYZ7_9PEZI
MRLSLALTGLAAVAVNASCKGRSSGSSTGSSTGASSGSAYNTTNPSYNTTSGAASSVSSAAALSSPTSSSASGNVKAASTSTTSAANSGIKGFNYGAFFLNQQALTQTDFEAEFNRANNLPGTSGWNSARLYTMIQWGTASDVIPAIPAAIATQTTLLLGLWISGGDAAIANELTALETAISTYGTAFTDLVVGISVGSEDLYRDANGEVGTSATYLLDCISQVRAKIADTGLANVPVGHVDTYDSFLNSTNTAVIEAIDWIGFDGYPYWETALPNSIEDAHERFYSGYNKTMALANGKPVYVTETGWPVSGDDQNLAVASVENARTYWETIACSLISSGINIWWYTLQESQYGDATPDFGVYGAGDLSTLTPSYDLSC